jgi:oligopeptide transport system substrate-binding protein
LIVSGFRIFLQGAFVALVLSIGGAINGPALAKDAATLTRGNAEPDTLDPHKMKLLAEFAILRDIFEGLTKSDAEGKIVGASAQSWDVNDEGTIFTFHLRPNLKWSDGTPLTADDFVAGYQRLFDPATAAQSAAFLYTIKNGQQVNAGKASLEELGVSAPDDQTVIIELTGPNPAFPALIISGYTAPFPRHAFQAFGQAWAKPENLISNGAFKLTQWIPHTSIRLNRNPHYHDTENVKLDTVLYLPGTDGGTSVKQFRAGELDIAGGIPISQIEHLKRIMPGEVRTFPDLATLYLVPNMNEPGVSDLRVRQALSLAIDRRTLTEKVMKGMAIPAWRFSPPNVSNYDGAEMALKEQTMEERLEKARALMAAAGYTKSNPLKFTLRTTESRSARNIAIALRAMWQEIGVKAQIHNTEVKTHYSDLSGGNFELAVASYYGWDDPFEFLSLFTGAATQVSFNYGRYDNPAYDGTLGEAITIANIKKRHAKMAEAEHFLLEDLAIIPLFYPVARTLVSKNIGGYLDNPLNVHPSEYIWIKETSQGSP